MQQRRPVCRERREHSEKSRHKSRRKNTSYFLILDFPEPQFHIPGSFADFPWLQVGSVTITSSYGPHWTLWLSHHLPSPFPSFLPHMLHETFLSAPHGFVDEPRRRTFFFCKHSFPAKSTLHTKDLFLLHLRRASRGGPHTPFIGQVVSGRECSSRPSSALRTGAGLPG